MSLRNDLHDDGMYNIGKGLGTMVAAIKENAEICNQMRAQMTENEKRFLLDKPMAILLTALTGMLGTHRFATGKLGTGLLWCFTGGLFFVGWFFDIYYVASGAFMTKKNVPWTT